MMTIDRAKYILACYGGHFEQWPIEERLTLQHLIQSEPELRKEQQKAFDIDEELQGFFADFKVMDTDCLEQKILQALPDRDSIINSKAVTKKGLAGKPMIFTNFIDQYLNKAASVMVFMLLFAIGSVSFNNSQQEVDWFSSGMEDELALMAETLDSSYELELLALLEPELVEDELDLL